MSAADLGPEDTADGFLIAELAAVVGQDVVNRCALFYTRSGYCAGLYEWSPAGKSVSLRMNAWCLSVGSTVVRTPPLPFEPECTASICANFCFTGFNVFRKVVSQKRRVMVFGIFGRFIGERNLV